MGCAFACSYCYVRRMPIALFRKQQWGTWVDIKEQAHEIFGKELKQAKKKGPVTIFMSSSTDPYQPVEYKEKVTRALVEVMTAEKPDFLFVQTRSPLVTRDIDLFTKLKDRIRISITVETDLEEIRKTFTPQAPPVRARLHALNKLREAGLPVQAAISPVLPFSGEFPKKLSEIVDRVCVDDYFKGDGSGGKRTERLGIREIYKSLNLQQWYNEQTINKTIGELNKVFDPSQICISRNGFLPDPHQ
ncbi:radical SAM protein [Paenactinomyces guangxiensis]|uniref:Radical SAM protein n=2 Tax=Paenactinomyces guangxiensis TaxID=1490290 RepID=A0A7W1WPT6_9BACL|nr:radical SAM protein [Paenactinomyces guangxiensis]MBH8591306.1 radical SAM protein [Paenactinomyces guangxiensis]